MLLQAVSARKLGHAWLAASGILDLAQSDEEGCCELVAHRWLTDRDTPKAAGHAEDIRHQPDAVYGDGFRRRAGLLCNSPVRSA